ncbi:amino acid transporter [Lysinibacillus composti]|uniref:Uncharacterized protein n=1 Tax=Lysinibacillus composti TaxID=720633 RepID=A0A3N9U9F7_9BACI|nr:hypothetical protein [Lysinibacillus composti]MBM7610140.1 amino acid transporter [Lysinibacillus composti]RQW73214.1 hypothetical protein EBB45_17785 [Lysinibacillus composti]
MVDKFIEDFIKYKSKKKTRGYKLVGKKFTLLFFITFGLLIFFIIRFYMTWYNCLILPIIILFICIRLFDKKLTRVLNTHIKKDYERDKVYIRNYLIQKNIVNKEQFQILAKLIKEKGEEGIKRFELTPYIAMLLTATVFIFNNSNIEDYSFFMVIFIILISINPLLNVWQNLFHNYKFEVMINLSRKIEEVFLEESSQK